MKANSQLEITSKVIDFGSSVIQLAHVTRAGVWVQYPLRSLGSVLLAIAGGLLGREIYLTGGKLALPAGGSVLLWGAFGATALGIFMLAYARRRILIATTDGARMLLPSGDAQFAAAVVACLKDAMAAGPTGDTRVRIDIATRTMTSVPSSEGRTTTTPIPIDDLKPTDRATAGGLHEAYRSATAESTRRITPARTLSTAPLAAAADRSNERRDNGRLAAASSAGISTRMFDNGGSATLHTATAATATRPAARNDDELTALIQFVRKADVQHKQALLDLLRVVEDYKTGGPVSREEAEEHWRSFADYVQQYLGAFEGLPDLTRRAGRSIGAGERSARL